MRSRLQPLIEFGEVRASVHLDLGLIAYCFAEPGRALQHFAGIDAATDNVDLRFLGQFLLGWIHGRDGRPDASEMAYRAAHALRPDAQSAAVGLSEILFTSGRRVEAAALVDQAIASAAEAHIDCVRQTRGSNSSAMAD